MKRLTGLGKAIIATDPDKVRLDLAVKNILAYKPLLAKILKEVVMECRDMEVDEIVSFIEGEVLVSGVYVDSGLSNVSERIDGLSTEAYLNEEGLDKYDLRTYLHIPGKDVSECVKLLINVEAQNDDKPGYDISLRALFYCCRMISAQQGVEFSTDTNDPIKYGNIKKVYSIWICTDTAQKRANSIERYAIDRSMMAGSNTDEPRYDIMNAIIINISGIHDTEDTDNELIRMLTDLFDERIDGAHKIDKLKGYGLKLTEEVEREVSDMCTYATAMEKKGMQKGIEKGIEKGQNELVDVIKRLRNGESREQLIASGMDEHTVDLAMVVK